MEIIWYAGERLPCWHLDDNKTSAVSIRNLLSSLIYHGNEALPNSLISSRALTGRHSAWSLRLSLGAQQQLKHDNDDNDVGEGDKILPPTRFTTFYCHIRRLSTGLHLWESPLVAAQRAEAFIIATTSTGVLSEDTPRVFRVDPVDAQVFIARTVTSAASDGVLLGNDATGTIFAATDFELRSYSRAAEELYEQRARVKNGGELWTRVEMLKKLSALRGAAERALRSAATGTVLTDEGKSAIEAVAAGDAAMAADAGGGQLRRRRRRRGDD